MCFAYSEYNYHVEIFDASCITSSHVSLNELLTVSPTVQAEFYATLIHFRLHKYVVTADIKKMYQLVLWSFFQLNIVTYCTTSATE